MPNPKQVFKCFKCGDEITTSTFHDCDCIEGSRCTECNNGIYEWARQANYKPPASVLPSYDDAGKEIDAAFDNLIN